VRITPELLKELCVKHHIKLNCQNFRIVKDGDNILCCPVTTVLIDNVGLEKAEELTYECDKEWIDSLDKIFPRKYWSGFWRGFDGVPYSYVDYCDESKLGYDDGRLCRDQLEVIRP
jgi:hypothetical protein